MADALGYFRLIRIVKRLKHFFACSGVGIPENVSVKNTVLVALTSNRAISSISRRREARENSVIVPRLVAADRANGVNWKPSLTTSSEPCASRLGISRPGRAAGADQLDHRVA